MGAALVSGALDGIRVIDLTHALAGPFCTMMLGDQGAEILKIERPERGDISRNTAYPSVLGENSSFLAVNRNKQSVVINLRSEQGRAALLRLVRDADVFVENFRPGKAAALGLGWEDLHKLNPRLVYSSISGWGSSGPYASRAGVASTAEALAGLMSVTGEQSRPPVRVGVSIIDTLTGVMAKDGITAALFARQRSGVGQLVETSLLESTVAVMNMSAVAYLMSGQLPGRHGSEHPFIVPWRNFATADGYVFVSAGGKEQWASFCSVLGRPELADDRRFARVELRRRNREELYTMLDPILRTRPTAAWVDAFVQAKLPAAPVNTIDETFKDPQVLARGMVEYMEHPKLGRIPQLGSPQKFSENGCQLRLPPPMLGEHTRAVLSRLGGYSAREIESMHHSGAIHCAELDQPSEATDSS